jgi:hypothetical protein
LGGCQMGLYKIDNSGQIMLILHWLISRYGKLLGDFWWCELS